MARRAPSLTDGAHAEPRNVDGWLYDGLRNVQTCFTHEKKVVAVAALGHVDAEEEPPQLPLRALHLESAFFHRETCSVGSGAERR